MKQVYIFRLQAHLIRIKQLKLPCFLDYHRIGVLLVIHQSLFIRFIPVMLVNNNYQQPDFNKQLGILLLLFCDTIWEVL